jgi:transposase-like protein
MQMSFFTDEQIKQFIKEGNLKTAQDIQNALKEMFGKTLETMLESELENELGYSKYDYKSKQTDNSRNGHTKKKVLTDSGEINPTGS